MRINSKTRTYLKFIFLILLISGCSFKIPPGKYTTALPMSSGRFSLAGYDFTLTENGRFQYKQWSDDAAGIIGHGGYIIIKNNLLLFFENANVPKSSYTIREIRCTQQDSQLVNFKIMNPSRVPIAFVSIYNRDNHKQGAMTVLDGMCHVTMPKTINRKVFIPHHMYLEKMEIEIEGDKCLDVEVIIKQEIDRLQRGQVKAMKLKRDGDQLYIKMQNWRDYNAIYLRDN